MTPRQRIETRMAERRAAMDDLVGDGSEPLGDETTTRLTELRAAQRNDDTALSVTEPHAQPQIGDTPDSGRVELRQAASLAEFYSAAVSGRPLGGASAELASEIGLNTGHIPLEMVGVERRSAPVEHRADNVSAAPGTVGINLDPVVPAIFARSVSPRLGIDMPRVPSGTYATGTITTSLTAAAKAKGDAIESSPAAITVVSTTPHRVSARLSIAIEDIAAIGTANFEGALRENLSLALSAKLDEFMLRGTNASSTQNPNGLLTQLTAPASDPSAVANWIAFVKAISDGIDGGPWGSSLTDVRLLVNAETQRLAETTFRVPTGDETKGFATPGEMSAAAYLRAHSGGFFASSRMPATASSIAQAVRYRPGTMGLDGVDAVRTAVCPVWSEVGIDDIYTDSASGLRHVTFHVLVGDLLIVQSDAYKRVDFKVSA